MKSTRCLLFALLSSLGTTVLAQDVFPNDHLLVRTDRLEALVEDAGARLVDVRSAADYRKGHLPGAVSLPTEATFAKEGPRMMLAPAKDLAALFGEQGIDRETAVILYDEGRSTAAARVFWTLEVLGHERVSVLDGGYAKWVAEKRSVTRDAPAVPRKSFVPTAPTAALSTLDVVLEDVESDDVVMLDARSLREFDRGRIPAAVRIEWTENYTADDVPVFKSPKELRALYATAGVTPEKRVHAY